MLKSSPSSVKRLTSHSVGYGSPPVKLKELLGPKAEKEFAECRFGLLAVSMGLHNPELQQDKEMRDLTFRIHVTSARE